MLGEAVGDFEQSSHIFMINMMVLKKAHCTCLLLLSLCSSQAVKVGETLCVEGVVMDYFCIARGTLFDNPSIRTLEGAHQHSVHCLVDVPECITSPFEVLLDPKEGEKLYKRGWRLDDATRAKVLELGQSARNTVSQGLRVALDAKVINLGTSTVPPTVSGSNVRVSNFLTDACKKAPSPAAPMSPAKKPVKMRVPVRPMSPVRKPASPRKPVRAMSRTRQW
jgi:hypothetical protein